MDIFTIRKSDYLNGELVNGLESVSWIEKYREPGEFKIICEPTDALRSQLARGTLISHTGTYDVMMVEDHNIEDKNGKSVFTITGRSLDAFLENRIASANNFSLKNPLTEKTNLYSFPAAKLSNQIVYLIREHIMSAYQVLNIMDDLPNVDVISEVVDALTINNDVKELVVKRGDLSKAVQELLKTIDCGIRVERPKLGVPSLRFIVHSGTDKTGSVQFSHENGDLENSRYFWSIKKAKNAALVAGEYYSRVIRPVGLSAFDVRMMFVEYPDLDDKPTESAPQLAYLDSVLNQVGLQALRENSEVEILETSVSRFSKYKYLTHYNIGDFVFVRGNYGMNSVMRITSYASIEDKTGAYGIPTLSPLS